MEYYINKYAITVYVETDDPDCLGYVCFYPAGTNLTYNKVQTGRGGIKTILAACLDLAKQSGLKQVYFETDGCMQRARIYTKYLQRYNIDYYYDVADDIYIINL